MARVHRFDRIELRPPQKRADGSVRYDAVLSRVGVFEYRTADGKVRREYRSPEEVGRADSLASLELTPVTDGHPAKPGLAKKCAVGTVGDTVKFDGQYVKASIVVLDDAVNERIARGDVRELSPGYSIDLDETPGVSPEGEAYHARQTNIIYEHHALVPRGRQGSTVALRADEADAWRADAAVMVDPFASEVRIAVHSAGLSTNDLIASVRAAIASIDGVTLTEPGNYGIKEDSVDAALRPGSTWDPGVPPGRAAVQVCSREMGLADLTAKLKTALAEVDAVVGAPDPAMPPRTDHADVRAMRADAAPANKDTPIMDELKKALAEVAAQTLRADTAEKERDALKTQVAAEKARADKAEGERDSHKERADAADKARKDAADAAPAIVRARIKLEDTAARVLGEDFKTDGLDDTAIRRAVVEKLTGKPIPADKSADYVAARFDSAIELAVESTAANGELRRAAVEADRGRADDETDPRAQMIERQRKLGEMPLTPTRSN